MEPIMDDQESRLTQEEIDVFFFQLIIMLYGQKTYRIFKSHFVSFDESFDL